MRNTVATLVVASLISSIVVTSTAWAAPTQVNVRIEGKSETLFEGPILTDGHDVRATSDTLPRSCDGTNNGQHASPAATPTAASADAMSLIGESFDGQWYAGYDDYFLTRWGPDEQSITDGAYWGVLVNNVFTSVGGCQYELGADNEVLWVYDAFQSKPVLALFPAAAAYGSGARPLTATAELGIPFVVEVADYADDQEDIPSSTPSRAGSSPFPGAKVAPVRTSTKGFEQVLSEAPAAVSTDAQGKASITFTTPGWHRIKATALGAKDQEDAIRSNRLDVCVPPAGESDCGEPPAEDQVRELPRAGEQSKGEENKEAPVGEVRTEPEPTVQLEASSAPTTPPVASETGPTASTPLARLQAPSLDDRGIPKGQVGVSWRILAPGPGLSSWTIASRALGTPGSVYVTRATGRLATSALLTLPAGTAYELRITFTDVLGRHSTSQIGKVLVPRDDRWSALRYRGSHDRTKQPGAWFGTLSRITPGGQVSVRLAAGRPVFLLRASAADARAEVRIGAHREVFGIARGSARSARLIVDARRTHAGTVNLRVLKGTVDLDGVAVEP